MYFAEFYIKSAISEEIVEACGDRSILILDGRESFSKQREYCKDWCERYGFVGFSLHKGEYFSGNTCIAPFERVQ